MTLSVDEFIRRFLLHILPTGFHHIRYYGRYANARRKINLARVRELLISKTLLSTDDVTNDADTADDDKQDTSVNMTYICPECGAPMIIVETFARGQQPRAPPIRRGGS